MFNLGFSEILIIGVMALLLIGPKQLPEMARVLGRLIAEFKKATADLSGGLLDIKNDLQQPLRDGLDNIHRYALRITERPAWQKAMEIAGPSAKRPA